MADTIKPPKSVSTPVAPSSDDGGSFYSQHKGLVIGGILVLAAGGVYLYERSKSKTTSTGSQVITAAGPPTTVGSTNAALYQDLSTQFARQSTQISSGFSHLQTVFESYINAQSGAGSTPTTTNPTLGNNLQKAPTYSSFSTHGNLFTPDTVFKINGGTAYFKTAATNRAIPVPLTEARKLEHTGTRKYPQYTTYEKVT